MENEDELCFWLHTFLSKGLWTNASGGCVYHETLVFTYEGGNVLRHVGTYGPQELPAEVVIRVEGCELSMPVGSEVTCKLHMEDGVTRLNYSAYSKAKSFTVLKYYNANLDTRTLIQPTGAIARCRAMMEGTKQLGPIPIPQHCRLIAERTAANYWLHKFVAHHEMLEGMELTAVTNRPSWYEILLPGQLRPYLDLDKLTPAHLAALPEWLGSIKRTFKRVYDLDVELICMMSTEPSETRDGVDLYSMHVTVQAGRFFRTAANMKKFWTEHGFIAADKKQQAAAPADKIFADMLVYSVNQKMRIMLAPKAAGNTRVFKFVREELPLGDVVLYPLAKSLIVGQELSATYFDEGASYDWGVRYSRDPNKRIATSAEFEAKRAELTKYLDSVPTGCNSTITKVIAAHAKAIENSERGFKLYYEMHRILIEKTASLKMPGEIMSVGSGIDPVHIWNACRRNGYVRPLDRHFVANSVNHCDSAAFIRVIELSDWKRGYDRMIQRSNMALMKVQIRQDLCDSIVFEAVMRQTPHKAVAKVKIGNSNLEFNDHVRVILTKIQEPGAPNHIRCDATVVSNINYTVTFVLPLADVSISVEAK